MTPWTKNPRDFWAGLLHLAIGVGAVLIASHYRLGAAARMGPGYFPVAIGVLLAGLGLISIVRSFLGNGEPIGDLSLKELALVTAGTVLFGLLLFPVGLIGALLVLILVCASASREFRFDRTALLLMLMLIAFCVIVFVKLLGLPLPLIGDWFGAWGAN